MASKKTRSPRSTRETNPRKFKKKTSVLLTDKVVYVDYKNVDLLQRFVSDRAKIRNRRVTGNDVQQQREVANAIKVAREMALIPYAKRVSTQRTRPPRDGGDRYAARNAEAAEQVRQAAGASDVVDVVDVSDAAADDVALEDEEQS